MPWNLLAYIDDFYHADYYCTAMQIAHGRADVGTELKVIGSEYLTMHSDKKFDIYRRMDLIKIAIHIVVVVSFLFFIYLFIFS